LTSGMHWTEPIPCYGVSVPSTNATDGRTTAVFVRLGGKSITDRRGAVIVPKPRAGTVWLFCGGCRSSCCRCSCCCCCRRVPVLITSLICKTNAPASVPWVFVRMRRKMSCASASGCDWMSAISSYASSRSVSSTRFLRCRAAHRLSPSSVLYSQSFPNL
jgi:hypothetical protein